MSCSCDKSTSATTKSSSASKSCNRSPDLMSRDWVIASVIKLAQAVDPLIIANVENTCNGGKILCLSNINENAIERISVLTNNDKNNNYLYVEDFKVYVNNELNPIAFPELTKVVKNMYKYSDVQAFIAGEKTQKPFLVSNFGGTSDYKGKTFSGFVDFLSAATPFVPSTRNKCKKYTVCLNPDNHVVDVLF
jgi:hypothetical protein